MHLEAEEEKSPQIQGHAECEPELHSATLSQEKTKYFVLKQNNKIFLFPLMRASLFPMQNNFTNVLLVKHSRVLKLLTQERKKGLYVISGN